MEDNICLYLYAVSLLGLDAVISFFSKYKSFLSCDSTIVFTTSAIMHTLVKVQSNFETSSFITNSAQLWQDFCDNMQEVYILALKLDIA